MLLEYHDHVEIDGMAYPIKNNHKNYITALKVLRCRDILAEDKLEAVIPLLFDEDIPVELWEKAITAYFNLFNKKPKDNRPPSFDIIQDSDYIYAGFMQTYGIDLDECDLKIEKFIAMIKGLPSDTKLAEIIKIRTMPIPTATKNNARQIADIIRAKTEVALEGDTFGKGMQTFGQLVKEWARHGR